MGFMMEKIKQYKNLILVAAGVILLTILIASDPLGFCAQRAHDREAIRNQVAIEKAQTEQQIAIIKAQTDAELKRIEMGLEPAKQQERETTETEVDTPAEVVQ